MIVITIWTTHFFWHFTPSSRTLIRVSMACLLFAEYTLLPNQMAVPHCKLFFTLVADQSKLLLIQLADGQLMAMTRDHCCRLSILANKMPGDGPWSLQQPQRYIVREMAGGDNVTSMTNAHSVWNEWHCGMLVITGGYCSRQTDKAEWMTSGNSGWKSGWRSVDGQCVPHQTRGQSKK